MLAWHTLAWHAYNKDASSVSSSTECQPYHNNHAKTKLSDLVSRFKLWPNLLGFDEEKLKPDLLFGLEAAVDIIYKNQHPPDCKKAKFLVSNNWDGGFGSEIHVNGNVRNAVRCALYYPINLRN